MTAPAWEAHLPAGVRAEALDITRKGSLPAAWLSVWATSPSTPTLFDGGHGWINAEQLEDATRRVAGRLQGAGLEPGDRMLFSAESSLDLVIAHVAALRSGVVVVPTNTAYRQREVAHIVTDACPKAALVDDPDRARWVRDAAGGESVVVGPEVDLPDHEPLVLHPREVEDVLLSHPSVAEVAVIGTPSDEWGEVVTAFVVATDDQPAPDVLLAFAAEQLAPFKRSRLVHFVESLPRNALGKVVKHELAREANGE